ncbi:MAG: hypothetical protein ORN98_04420, partial [Alphaproteobacteria bacterium]|nr:hypothetical protein [Alphaproteobacteria bacterium]
MVLDAGSQIFAQNFIATTSNIDPVKFMQGGQVTLEKSSNNARITLKGTITAADRGIVGIFAPKVENQGTIIANLGSVVLAGVQSSVIDFNGDGLINFELGATTGRSGENLLASNKGVINASGGRVTLTAQGAESLFNAIVENTGAINATSLTAKGGTVTLKSNLGSVNDSGTIEASGATGGGNVLVWATERADYTGDIKAEALASNTPSNGGAVEVSGLKQLNFNGTVSTLSHNGGKTGSLLLDPSDITIGNGADNNISGSSPFTGTAGTSFLSAATLSTALASNNVTVDATGGAQAATGYNGWGGSITVTGAITWSSGRTLTLKAGTSGAGNLGGKAISIEANIDGGSTGANAGTLTLITNGNTSPPGIPAATKSYLITNGGFGYVFQTGASVIKIGTVNLDVGTAQLENTNNEITHIGNVTATNNLVKIRTKTAVEITGIVNVIYVKPPDIILDSDGRYKQRTLTGYSIFSVVASGGNITQSSTSSITSVLLVMTATKRNADNTVSNADIILNSQNNHISRIQAVTGQNFTLVTNEDLILGEAFEPAMVRLSTPTRNMNIDGTANLTVTNGGIIQVTDLQVGTLTLSTAGAVDLKASLIYGGSDNI